MIIDMHTHAGRDAFRVAVDPVVLQTMRSGGAAACVVAAVADAPLIGRDLERNMLVQLREPKPGECLATTLAQLDAYDACGFRIAREPDDIRIDDPAIVLAVEGGDFLEGDLDRLDMLETRGVRCIQPVHYVPNELGDIQTRPPLHGGLTPFGADAVRRMERLGIIVDVAHCTEAVVRGVAEVASHPFLCTHTNLAWPGRPDGGHKRFISREYARLVAESGGVVGAWLAVLRDEGLAGFIEHIFRLVEVVGAAHVGIGTDMPEGAGAWVVPDFTHYAAIARSLGEGGLSEEEVAQVCGGNWLRVFRAVRGAAPVH
jgi:membrane dipeptidase